MRRGKRGRQKARSYPIGRLLRRALDLLVQRFARTLALLICLAAMSSSPLGAASAATLPTLLVSYDGTAPGPTVTLSDGTDVGAASAPGTIIPAGTYNVDIAVTSGTANFQLSGPGVDLTYTEPTEAVFALTLAPGATYVYSDLSDPESTTRFFSTTSTVAATTPAPAPPVSGGEQSNTDVVGSSNGSTLTLTATVSAESGAALTDGGRAVKTLAAGRYRIRVADLSRKAGFVLVAPSGKRIALTSNAFVGSLTRTLTLTKGTWFYAAGSGRDTSFRVAA